MTGNELRKAINNSGVPISEILRLSGLKERTLFSLYHKEEVKEHYIRDIKKAGVDMHKTANNSTANSDNELFRLKIQVDLLTSRVKDLEDELAVQKHFMSELKTVTFKKRSEKKLQGK